MKQHTPGPWVYEYIADARSHGYIRVNNYPGSPKGIAICRVLNRKELGYNTVEANAHLIAAAPEMLEALKEAVEIAEGKRSGTWDDLLKYRPLIQKAEGN